MKPSPARFVTLSLVAAAILALAAGWAAESTYRSKMRQEWAALERSIVAFHPECRLNETEFLRFGESAPSIEPSLWTDLVQGTRSKLGLHSRLDVENDPWDPYRHAYHAASFDFERRSDYRRIGHVFILSPRKMSFVHYATWNECRSDCPWRRSPLDDLPCSRGRACRHATH